jgi:hypothetical protein
MTPQLHSPGMAHHRLKIVVAGGVAALALASCGGGGEIPDREADAMLAQLGQIEGAVEAEDCAAAESGFNELQGTVGELGRAVDREVQEDLTALTVSLESELGDFCAEVAEPEETEEIPAPVEPTPEAVPPAPEEEVVPEDETIPPGQGGPGRGQGQGRGGGDEDDSGGIGAEDG